MGIQADQNSKTAVKADQIDKPIGKSGQVVTIPVKDVSSPQPYTPNQKQTATLADNTPVKAVAGLGEVLKTQGFPKPIKPNGEIGYNRGYNDTDRESDGNGLPPGFTHEPTSYNARSVINQADGVTTEFKTSGKAVLFQAINFDIAGNAVAGPYVGAFEISFDDNPNTIQFDVAQNYSGGASITGQARFFMGRFPHNKIKVTPIGTGGKNGLRIVSFENPIDIFF